VFQLIPFIEKFNTIEKRELLGDSVERNYNLKIYIFLSLIKYVYGLRILTLGRSYLATKGLGEGL